MQRPHSVWLGALAAMALSASAAARDPIVVGSALAAPLAAEVAGEDGLAADVRATGTAGGLRLMCGSNPDLRPDIVLADRPIREVERTMCADAGVDAIAELRLGAFGVALITARDARPLALGPDALYRALAAELPLADDDCTAQANPNLRWSDIDPDLPSSFISIALPPLGSAARAALLELGREAPARARACVRDLRFTDRPAYRALARSVRADAGALDGLPGEDAIAELVMANPTLVGVVSIPRARALGDDVRMVEIDGVEADFDAVSQGRYPLARALYLYVDLAAAETGDVAGLEDYVRALACEAAAPEGALAAAGLAPLRRAQRRAQCADFALQPMAAPDEE